MGGHALSRKTARVLIAGVLLIALLPVVFLDRYPSVYEDEIFFNYPAVQAEFRLRPWQVAQFAPHWRGLWAYDLTVFHVVQRAAIHTLGLSLATMRLTSLVASTLAIAVLCGVLLEYGTPVLSVLLAVLWIGDRSYIEALFSRPEGPALLCLAVSYWAALRFRQHGRLGYSAMAGAAAAAAVTFHPATGIAMLAVLCACAVFASQAARRRALAVTAVGASVPFLLLGLLLWPQWAEALEQFGWHAEYMRLTTPTFERLYWFNWALGWARAWSWLTIALAPVVFVVAARRYWNARYDTHSGGLSHASAMLLASSMATALIVARPPYLWHPYFLLLVTPFVLLASLLAWNVRPQTRMATGLAMAALAVTWMPSAAQNALRVRGGFYAYALTDPAIMRRDLVRYLPRGARVSLEPVYLVPSVQVGLDVDVLPWFGEAGELPHDRWLILTNRYSGRPEIQNQTARHLNQYQPGSKWFSAPYTIVAPASPPDGGGR